MTESDLVKSKRLKKWKQREKKNDRIALGIKNNKLW